MWGFKKKIYPNACCCFLCRFCVQGIHQTYTFTHKHTHTPGHLFCFARSLISWNVTLTITCNQIPQGDTNTCTNKGGWGRGADRQRQRERQYCQHLFLWLNIHKSTLSTRLYTKRIISSCLLFFPPHVVTPSDGSMSNLFCQSVVLPRNLRSAVSTLTVHGRSCHTTPHPTRDQRRAHSGCWR